MADNTFINTATTPTTIEIATDDVGGVQHELVKLEFGSDGTATMVDAANPLPTTTKEFGAWGYVANSLTGAGNVTGAGRCVGIRVFANGVDSTFNIGGGNTIPVRNGAGVDIAPKGNLVNAVVNWVSGSIDVIIESVT